MLGSTSRPCRHRPNGLRRVVAPDALDRMQGVATRSCSAGHPGPGKEDNPHMISLTPPRLLRRGGIALALIGALAATPALAQGQAAGGAPAAFTTADLARLCGPAADNANTQALRPACYAALVTIGQVHAIYTSGRGAQRPVFCQPEQAPTLDTVAAAFVSWAAANQQYSGARAAEGVLRFAAATYPCQPAALARRR